MTQTTPRVVLDWQSFNIAPQETVNFFQPGAKSVALNRVQRSNASEIFGRLNANGQVFLVNPSGVYFAPSAQVSVGGIVASALGIDNQDFLTSNFRFSGESTHGAVKPGSIKSAPGGYVAMIGRTVDNQSTINTPGGTTALGAGGSVNLTLAGNQLLQFQVSPAALGTEVNNGGAIQAGDGTVILSARSKNAVLQSVVNNTGVIRAQGVRKSGGVIELLGGSRGTVSGSGRLDVSAPTSTGGKIVATGQHVVRCPPGSGATAGRAANYVLAQPMLADITVSPKALTIGIIGTPTKIYEGLTSALLTPENFNFDGFVGGQGAVAPVLAGRLYL